MLNQSSHQTKNRVEALLALTLVHQLGAQRIRLLLQSVDHPAEIFTMSHTSLQEVEGIGSTIAQIITDFNNWQEVDHLLEKTERVGANILTFYDDAYPPLLREIYDPPVLLWVKGKLQSLSSSGVAVVGTRRATQYGKDVAAKLSKQMVKNDLTIVSGLAYGVDAAAHKATVDAGGTTVAVLGSGIDVIYPQKHGELAHEIIDGGGAIITEFPLGTPPDAGNFPERNRIISGLTPGTLVVESGLKGGSMITAQSALVQNREVFVVPHSLENVNGVGCNHLIKRGAGKLVQTVDDILEELPRYKFINNNTPAQENDAEEFRWENEDLDKESQTICKLLGEHSMHIDELSEESGLPSHQLLSKLLELEMMDCVRQSAGKNFELK